MLNFAVAEGCRRMMNYAAEGLCWKMMCFSWAEVRVGDRGAAIRWRSTRNTDLRPGGWAVEPPRAKRGTNLVGNCPFGMLGPESGIPKQASAIQTGFGPQNQSKATKNQNVAPCAASPTLY